MIKQNVKIDIHHEQETRIFTLWSSLSSTAEVHTYLHSQVIISMYLGSVQMCLLHSKLYFKYQVNFYWDWTPAPHPLEKQSSLGL